MIDELASTAAAAAASAPGGRSMALLRHPDTIRLRCRAILDAVADDRSANFRIDRSRLDDAAARVAALTRERFPDLARIPLHSRWRHFEAGGVDRKAELDAKLAGRSVADAARARIDLTVTSVLLDAGAGAQWRYTDADGRAYGRSEGLGVASFRAFMAGRFSDRMNDSAGDPLRADATALARIDAPLLRQLFGAGPENPMVGLEGRAALLARLGRAIAPMAEREGLPPRPGLLWDRLERAATAGADGVRGIDAATVLAEVLRLTGPAWDSGSVVMGQAAGDVWPHRWAGAAVAGGGIDPVTTGVVPFHKLSQWLTYSLIEPLGWAGLAVRGIERLTGLPEYRNGGLLLDTGVIVPRSPHLVERTWKPADEPIIEWRALTVALVDELAVRVRAQLGPGAEALPLACILEGGTWAAGRQIAAEKRGGDGTPPLKIASDGTVF